MLERAHLVYEEEDLDEDDFPDCFCGQAGQFDNSVCTLRTCILSKPGRVLLLVCTLLTLYVGYTGLRSDDTAAQRTPPSWAAQNQSRAQAVLSELCDAYAEGRVSGDLCNRLCYQRHWEVVDFYESNKVVIVARVGGQEMVLKSEHAYISQFDSVDPRVNESDFFNALLDIVNYNLRLGWSTHYKRHLIEILWPMYVRKLHAPLSEADRRSLWALLSQEEYITFRVLPLSRVTPEVIGTCGHFYQVEKLVAFRMKGYYMNLKAKILLHLMGTLKLFDEFLNEPLQWCDVKFDNLGLAAEYPKRFMVMDADMLYTTSRLKALFTSRQCETDVDCKFFDCHAKCLNMTNMCSDRINSNVEVFCTKLITQLFGNFWSKGNRYLAACHDTSRSFEEKMADLRLAWSWNMADV